MAKVTGPALSLGAKGTIADTLTYQKKGGGHSAYGATGHKDAKSYPQLLIRSYFKDAVAAWKLLTPAEKGEWNDFVAGKLEY